MQREVQKYAELLKWIQLATGSCIHSRRLVFSFLFISSARKLVRCLTKYFSALK